MLKKEHYNSISLVLRHINIINRNTSIFIFQVDSNKFSQDPENITLKVLKNEEFLEDRLVTYFLLWSLLFDIKYSLILFISFYALVWWKSFIKLKIDWVNRPEQTNILWIMNARDKQNRDKQPKHTKTSFILEFHSFIENFLISQGCCLIVLIWSWLS